MPRFFFHVRSADQDLSLDELGLDYPDGEIACGEAFRAAQGLENVFAARGEDPGNYALEIEDTAGVVVVRVPFSDIFGGRAAAAAPSQDCDDDLREQGRVTRSTTIRNAP